MFARKGPWWVRSGSAAHAVATASRSTPPASAGLRRTAIRLATVVTTRTPVTTSRESRVGISGIVYYMVARAARKRQGINVDLVFAEIPPE